MCSICMVHKGDAAHLHVTTNFSQSSAETVFKIKQWKTFASFCREYIQELGTTYQGRYGSYVSGR